MDRKDGRNTPPKPPSPGMARLIATYNRNKARRLAREAAIGKAPIMVPTTAEEEGA